MLPCETIPFPDFAVRKRAYLASSALLSALLVASLPCAADEIDVVNAVRASGCDGGPGADRPLDRNPSLDAAAAALADGDGLAAALEKSGYPAARSRSIYLQTTDPGRIGKVLARRYCETVADPDLHDIGVFERRKEIWIVLAAPFGHPAAGDADKVAGSVVELINEARRHSRRCGERTLPAAGPLESSARLERAALRHARDLAASGRLGHEGSDRSLPADRVAEAGYEWAAVAENVAAGPATAADVVQLWLESPGHCANLMDARFTETGVAYAFDPSSGGRTYWVQVFATPEENSVTD